MSDSQARAPIAPPSGFAGYLERLRLRCVPGFLSLRTWADGIDEPVPLEPVAVAFERLQAMLAAAVEQASPRSWVLVGPPGSGKTSMVVELMVRLLQQGIACACLTPASPSWPGPPEDARALVLSLCPPDVDEALWRARVKRGAIVLFIDAGDDLFPGNPRQGAEYLGRLLGSPRRFPIVVTARREPRGLEPAPSRLSFAALSGQEISRYLDEHGVPAGPALARISAAGLEGSASNPWVLAMLLPLLEALDSPSLPKSRAGALLAARELAWRCSQGDHWTAERLKTLCVAAALLSLRSGEFELDQLSAALRAVWPDVPALHATLPRCLLAPAGAGCWRFVHDSHVSLHLALAFRGQPLPALAWHAEGPEQFCADWVGLHHDPERAARSLLLEAPWRGRADLLPGVVVANRGVLSPSLQAECWVAVGRSLGAERGPGNRTIERLVALPGPLLREALQHGLLDTVETTDLPMYQAVRSGLLRRTLTVGRFEDLRARSVKEAEREPEQDGGDPLAGAIRQLRLAKGPFRRAAANALGQIGDAGAILALTQVLVPGVEPEPKVRGSATNALGQIGDRSAVPALASVLQPGVDPEPRVRASAATALGHIGDRRGLPALALVLDPAIEAEPRVRGSAANALGNIGDSLAIPALARVLAPGGESEARVRASAANALGRIGDPDGVPALSAVLDPGGEADANVRASAVDALGQIRDPRAVPALSRALQAEQDAFVRASAASALGQIGDRVAVSGLVRALEVDVDAVVRGSAAGALGAIGDRAGIPGLVHVLEPGAEKDPVVRGSAAKALGLIGARAAVPALAGVLGLESDAFVRGSAATALGEIGDRAAAPALIRSLHPSIELDGVVRDAAAAALGRIGDTAAVGPLSHLLRDPETDPAERASAAIALGSIGDPGAVAALAGTLDAGAERDPGVRCAAITALGQIADRRAFPSLARVVEADGDAAVRAAAVTVMGQLAPGPERWMLELELRLARRPDHRDDRRVRASALKLLAQHAADARMGSRLRAIACREPDARFRTLAVEALGGTGGLDDATVRYLLDPLCLRKDGHDRDPDPGVQAAIGAAIVGAAASGWAAPGWVDLVARMLAAVEVRTSLLREVLEPLASQPPALAAEVLGALVAVLPGDLPEALVRELRLQQQRVAACIDAERSLRSVVTDPLAVLRAFAGGGRA